MELKKLYIVSCVAGALLSVGLGAKVFADNYWQGHGEVEAINEDIDTLSTRLHSRDSEIVQLNSNLSVAKNSAQSFSSQVTNLQQQLTQSEQASQAKENENQRKLTESNQHLAVLNQQLVTVSQQLEVANQKSASDDQTIAANAQALADKQNELDTANQTIISDAQALSSKQSEVDTANQTIANLQQQIKDLQQVATQAQQPASQTTPTPQAQEPVVQTTPTTSEYPAWNPKQTYNGGGNDRRNGDKVTYEGKTYIANWTVTGGATPDKVGPYGAWSLLAN
ncbi:hypothetical protein [Lactococcus kimchii]|uniref:hypothetical protein n=1 Tax=Lactococcus sp. S-13 TaxID=2507158 RepID=UPI0010231BB6|nr:hypothetical protein [Lactococcus sp. S-13]RZI49228.1 hypothetical protein EQJ87_07110 [Lactococcus sp. S-13]